MATQSREQAADLNSADPDVNIALEPLRDLLERDPHSVRFFQAVRLLERLYPERKPVGLFVSPGQEVVRFTSVPTFAFPASEIQELEKGKDGRVKMAVNFMGLSAAVGALPHIYTDFLLERARAKDRGPGDFFDLFNHRIVSLFYRAWQKYRFYVAYERTGAGDDAVSRRLFDFIGLGTEGLHRRLEIADEACLYYTSLLSQRRPTAQGLQQLLCDYFGVPVQILQFTGKWNRLPPGNQTFLRDMGMFCEQLGMGTIVGDEVWDQHGTVTIRLGPMNFERYQQFLPGADAYRELRSWLLIYANREFDFIVQLVLERNETPGMKLGEIGPASSRLGLVSWIKNRPLLRDPDEATYQLS
ncbi:MAG TPA: type VI secretion system baseplate subunit TssG [Pseudacidobacterium sp.]|jgi:type VI secretion system protein ImpH|nr:type VI secretion system baseplate subunit TssG [Pseudacidobacterium sp.]